MEAPRYKTLRATHNMGIPYAAGVEISVSGWPGADVEPINESARRIAGWLGRFGSHLLKPHSPSNALAGGIYLPGVLPDFGPVGVFNHHFDTPQNSTVAPVRESEVLAGMPLYTVNVDLHLGKTHVPAKTEFAFLGRPLEGFEPVNEGAKAVTAYYADNKDNPALLPSPWCCYRQDVALPDLPEQPADPKVSIDTRERGAEIQAQDRSAARARAEARTERGRKARSWEGLTP
jgi:hypothetical protein